MIPYQSPNSSVQGILQEQPIPEAWQRSWGVDGNWFQVNWLESQGLEDFLQQYVAAIAHLDGPLVRPRWQPEPPNLPSMGQPHPLGPVNFPPPPPGDGDPTGGQPSLEAEIPCWAAVGLVRQRPLGTYAWVGKPEDDQLSELQRHEELEVLVSFYGPDGEEVAGRFHSNLSIWQNIALLRLVGLAFVETGETVWAPELVKERWLMRVDKRIVLRRIVRRNYPILSVLEACGRIITDPDGYVVQWCTPPAPPVRPPWEGVPEAPEDNILYGRRRRQWQPALPRAGGTMEGRLDLAADPQDPLEAATRRYVDIKDGGHY